MTDRPDRDGGSGPEQLLAIARRVMALECEALTRVSEQLGDSFVEAVQVLDGCTGKAIVTGLGKSGIAAKKIAATLASTGTPAFFLHAAEAGHGDLGVVSKGDVVVALSYSGETREVNELIPRFKLMGAPVVALTGNPRSTLAGLSDCILNVHIPEHDWPFGLVPTASIAVTIAVGDALAVALIVKRGIRAEDFAFLHPRGLIGRRLLIRVDELMHSGAEVPAVAPDAGFREVLMEMTAKRLGVACVVDGERRLLGIFTDGDLRRLLERNLNPLELTAAEIMTPDPKWIAPDTLSTSALHLMEANAITSLPVLDGSMTLIGIIHMHDIIKLETSR